MAGDEEAATTGGGPPSSGADVDGHPDWPVALRGITESVVATRQPGGAWNVAALGLHAGDPVTARTWGETRTRRNLAREGGGVVAFTRDPVVFVEAALSILEVDEPVVESADAWVRVEAERLGEGESGGTRWREWALRPLEADVRRETVPTVNRGYNAVVEATIAASRLGVEAYDEGTLRDRLDYFGDVARRCGGEPERRAMDRLEALLER